MKSIRMEEMNWPDIKAAVEKGFTTVVIGVGSTEQHGPHLPTMTDTRIGEDIAHRVALALGNTLQARTIAVGMSEHHLAFPGTISLKVETLKAILHDYVNSLVKSGFTRIIFIPSHGGNFGAVAEVIVEASAAHPTVEITGFADLMAFSACLDAASGEYGISPGEAGGHAGENETSMMLTLEPSLVVADRFAPGYVGELGEKQVQIVFEQGMTALTANGVLGDPRKSSGEKGEVYLQRLTAFLVGKILTN